MLAKFPSWERPNSRAISESADEPQTLLRDSGIADGQSFFSLLAWEDWSSPKAVAVVMSARVRTSLLPPLSPSVQGRTEVRVIKPLPTCAAGLLHGWHVLLADDSPVQESAGSRQRLCEAAPQGEGNV